MGCSPSLGVSVHMLFPQFAPDPVGESLLPTRFRDCERGTPVFITRVEIGPILDQKLKGGVPGVSLCREVCGSSAPRAQDLSVSPVRQQPTHGRAVALVSKCLEWCAFPRRLIDIDPIREQE